MPSDEAIDDCVICKILNAYMRSGGNIESPLNSRSIFLRAFGSGLCIIVQVVMSTGINYMHIRAYVNRNVNNDA